MTYSVTAISWGDWRAEFVGPTDDGKHVVRIRTHRTLPKEPLVYTEVVVDDGGERGLREAIFAHGRRKGRSQHLQDSNGHWVVQLVDLEFPTGGIL